MRIIQSLFLGLVLTVFGTIFTLHAQLMTITQSGDYALGGDVVYTPTFVNDKVIFIDADNVVFDFANRVISQGNLIAGLNGVVVNQNRTNVIIRNGTVSRITGTGVLINSGCSRITIDNVITFSCDMSGIVLSGNASNQITNSEIKNCSVLFCVTNTASDALSLNNCITTKITNSRLNNNGTPGFNLSTVHLSNCQFCDCMNIDALKNKSGTQTTFDIATSKNCSFLRCIPRNNETTSGALTCFRTSGDTSESHFFVDCSAQLNIAASSLVAFDVAATSTYHVYKNCVVLGNTGSTVTGFQIDGASTTGHSFLDCLVNHNSATTIFTGFLISGGATSSVITRCIVSDNASATTAYGLQFITPTGGNFWSIENCLIARNIGSSDTNSFGISVDAGSNNLFTRNIAFANGPTSGPLLANQLAGVPTGSKTLPAATASTSVNSVTAPWTNFGAAQ